METEELKQKPRPLSDGSVRFILLEESLKEMEILSGRGLTLRQIAHYFDISLSALEKYSKKHPQLRAALRRGKSKTISYVSGKLIEQIKAGSTSATIFFLKTQAGWKDPNLVASNYESDEKVSASKLSTKTTDPNEAARAYQQIMLREKND